jgi:hypothetical protein
MILYLDLRNARQRLGLVTDKEDDWLESAGRRGEHAALDAAAAKFELGLKMPRLVVVATWPNGCGGDGTMVWDDDVSWSTARAAVAMGNALGFAWGVPVVAHERFGEMTSTELAEAARLLGRGAASDARIGAVYSGEPNITAPSGKK